jgi:hypothetical protein
MRECQVILERQRVDRRSASPQLGVDDFLSDLVAHLGTDVHREAVVVPSEDP